MKRILSAVLIISCIMSVNVFANEFKPGISNIEINQNNIVINNVKYDKSFKNGELNLLVQRYCYESSILPIRDVIRIVKDINNLIK